MTDQQSETPTRFQLSDRAWALSMCVIVGVAASSTSYFVSTVMKENYMNGMRAGLEIGGLITKIDERSKVIYDRVPENQTSSDELRQASQPPG